MTRSILEYHCNQKMHLGLVYLVNLRLARRDEAQVEPQVGLHSLWIDPPQNPPISCVRSSAGLIEVFSPSLHETGEKKEKKKKSLPPIDFKMSKLKS